MRCRHKALTVVMFKQGASPADVKAQLMASATKGAVQDDAAKADSLSGTHPPMLNISSTPNLLLYSMLNDQVGE